VDTGVASWADTLNQHGRTVAVTALTDGQPAIDVYTTRASSKLNIQGSLNGDYTVDSMATPHTPHSRGLS